LERGIQRKLFQTVLRVTEDFKGRWHFNTSIAATMELVNELYLALEHEVGDGVTLTSVSGPPLPTLDSEFSHGVFAYLTLLLAPFAPHLAHELWEMLGEKDLLKAPWPKYDPELAKEDQIEIPVQVNGKLRGLVVVAPGTSQDEILQKALAEEKVQTYVSGKEIVKKIFTGKLINIVVR
jgi:leucyl-tRNA synthetase